MRLYSAIESCIVRPKARPLEVLVAYPGFGLNGNFSNEVADGLIFVKQQGVPAQLDTRLLWGSVLLRKHWCGLLL